MKSTTLHNASNAFNDASNAFNDASNAFNDASNAFNDASNAFNDASNVCLLVQQVPCVYLQWRAAPTRIHVNASYLYFYFVYRVSNCVIKGIGRNPSHFAESY